MGTSMRALILIVLAGFVPALAQDGPFLATPEAPALRASDVLGADLYLVPGAVSEAPINEVPEEWEHVTTVDDLLVGSDGGVRGVLMDVGGFLGIGARTVLADVEALRLVEDADDEAVYVALAATREQLENAPEYEPAEAAVRVGAPEPGDDVTRVEWGELRADTLRGAPVYDRENERVSEVEDILLGGEGEATAALINVGGFLGIGSRNVAVPMEQLEIHADAELDDVRIYLTLSEEELEDLPEHE